MRASRPSRAAGGHARAAAQVAGDGQFDASFFTLGISMQECQVGFLNAAFAEFFHQLQMRGVVARNHHRSGSSLVEAMHDSRAQRAADTRKPMLRAEAMQQRGDQRAGIRACAGMDDHSGRFIYDGDVLVFVKYGERNIFRFHAGQRRRGNIHGNGFAGFQMMRGFFGDAAHAYAPFVNQRLHVRAADVWKLRGEEAVQALAGVFCCHHEFVMTEGIVWRVEIVVGVRIIVHEGLCWFCFASCGRAQAAGRRPSALQILIAGCGARRIYRMDRRFSLQASPPQEPASENQHQARHLHQ